ncbi:MAG: FAD-dependent oxidoreductase [Dehalococcoidales bacterium]
MMKLESAIKVTTDVLVIGGGGAGLRAAIEAKSHGGRVLMVSRSRAGYGSNTTISGGAFAAVSSPPVNGPETGDSAEQHFRDTIEGGCFLNQQSMVATVVENAARQVEDLRRFGVKYSGDRECPWITLSADPGHRRARMVYGEKAFGTDFTLPLRQHALSRGVEILEGILITGLLKKDETVIGAEGVDTAGNVSIFVAPAVVLASGGLGRIYARNDNAAGATGDGYAIAYDAGAVLQDMEFVQFYPAGLGSGTPALFYECLLLDSGGRLLNRRGEDIVAKYALADPMRLTRDRLSLAIAREVAAGLGFGDKVCLDLTEIKGNRREILRPVLPKAAGHGENRFLVAPTTHFHMGGVRINENAETSIPGLYAAGEICAGVHGANRLAGNALTEVWVFGTIAGREAARRAGNLETPSLPGDTVRPEPFSRQGNENPGALHASLQAIMWQKAGLIRDAAGLKQAIKEIDTLRQRLCRITVSDGQSLLMALRLGNTLTTAEMVCRAALLRTESRGSHYRRDYPARSDAGWLHNILITRKNEGMVFGQQAVACSRFPPVAKTAR